MKNFHTRVTEGGTMVGSGSGANIIANNQKPMKAKKSGSPDRSSFLGSNTGESDGPLGSGKGPNKHKPGLSMAKSGKKFKKPAKSKHPKSNLKDVAGSGYSDHKFRTTPVKFQK